MRRLRSIAAALGKFVVGLIVLVLVLVGIALSVVETGWAKDRIRSLIVRQANNYLTATLEIGNLEGSLLRGLQLVNVRLSRDGHAMIAIDQIALSYSLRELFDKGTVIRRVRLTRPRIVGARQADGRWDLGALIKRESREQERTGPGRPIRVEAIEIVDGDVRLKDPLEFGPTHLPTHFANLNASLSFQYYPVRWQIAFNRISWIGTDPELTVKHLTGVFGRGPTGWFFERLSVTTPRSSFMLDGGINTEQHPTEIDLQVRADRFAFQEWSGVLRGLRNIAIDAAFDTSLRGPTSALDTTLRLRGTGGNIKGTFTLDTSVPGWLGKGAVDVERLNLARWMNRPDRPSDITGHVTFNLALELGRHFPRGVYTFDGPHAMYMDYAGDNVHARGQITSTAVLVANARAVAYGANVALTDGSIAIDAPFPFRFQGTTTAIDLRRLPKPIPVPHVESLLTFEYDVSGRFSDPFIAGRASFARSEFLGAIIGGGTVGTIDTSQKPLRYTGEGEVDQIDLRRFGEGLDVGWLQDPRYAGTVSGRFRVDVAGTDRASLALTGGGRITRAELFHGRLSDADVTIQIENGTLSASYSGQLAGIDPSIPFADPRVRASLTGTGTVSATVHDLLTAATTSLDDYDITGTLAAKASTIRDVPIDSGRVEATLRQSALTIAGVEVAGDTVAGRGAGRITFSTPTTTDFQYDLTRADLAALEPLTTRHASGIVATTGRVSGPSTALHAVGDANVTQLDAFGVSALTLGGHYDATIAADDASRTSARVDARGSFLKLGGQTIEQTSGTITVDGERVGFDLQLAQAGGRKGALAGTVRVRSAERAIDVEQLTVSLGSSPWRLASGATSVVRWTDEEVSITPIEVAGGGGDERFGVSGNWRNDGAGTLRVTARHVFLETLQGAFERPTRYGGVLDADIAVSGTTASPIVSGTVSVSAGRVERITYQRLNARIGYTNRVFTIDARLDQSPGIWLTAVGTLPLALFNRDLPEAPIDMTVKSSTINLGLIEGATDVIRNVTGALQLDVRTVGTSRDPHFTGSVAIDNGAFLVASSGARYKNVRASFGLAEERITVETFHIEDDNGRPLDLRGSLGTHELRVGDVSIDVSSRRFEVMRSTLGKMEVDTALQIRGRFEQPIVSGTVTISSGSELKVDEILERALFRPYSTEETAMTDVDAVAALNPWDRMGLDIALHVPPGALRLVGQDVQVSPGAPIGLGDVNLRVIGDLYLYKDPAQPLYVTGSFDSVSGWYAFQGRRFDVNPTSSINFRGDLNPELYVTVTRVISGVEARVSIIGPLQQPELQLSSTPPLDQADILSLIVFNSASNQLSNPQQQELMVRAGALAAGFLAKPILSAIESELGLDILEFETTTDVGGGPRVTVGEEIAPGLVARFSRQFGPEPYDEATFEYYLSRLLRLRATFSDAQSLNARSPFRRIERTGIDLLVFLSF